MAKLSSIVNKNKSAQAEVIKLKSAQETQTTQIEELQRIIRTLEAKMEAHPPSTNKPHNTSPQSEGKTTTNKSTFTVTNPQEQPRPKKKTAVAQKKNPPLTLKQEKHFNNLKKIVSEYKKLGKANDKTVQRDAIKRQLKTFYIETLDTPLRTAIEPIYKLILGVGTANTIIREEMNAGSNNKKSVAAFIKAVEDYKKLAGNR